MLVYINKLFMFESSLFSNKSPFGNKNVEKKELKLVLAEDSSLKTAKYKYELPDQSIKSRLIIKIP